MDLSENLLSSTPRHARMGAGRMNPTWGVYKVQGRLKGGQETASGDRKAVSYFVRWRVDGRKRRRSFKTRGHANTFYDELLKAKLLSWEADDRGWPINPDLARGEGLAWEASDATRDSVLTAYTVQTYVEQVWWPTIRSTLNPKNRLGHERNARLAVQLLRLREGDRRVGRDGARVGDSIPLPQLSSDDVKAALVARRGVNGRTAAVNRRRVEKACAEAGTDTASVTLDPEVVSAATVLQFKITLGMIVAAASAGGHVLGDPMKGSGAFAPKPRQSRMSARLVPSLDELFDLADAIAQLGPAMPDRRPRGARFQSLILCAWTTGGRPGEYVAHRPDWFDWAVTPSEIMFHRTEAAIYGAELEDAERGRRVHVLKHREEGDFRQVPLISEVRSILFQHRERGYSSADRTWLSSTGRGHLDWHNMIDDYWRPALRTVFQGTSKAVLVQASPKILRKTAITWWHDQGISETLAADWAGHSKDVAEIYYASRASTTFAREVAMLERGRA